MEIKKNAITVNLDHDEKSCLKGAIEIIEDIMTNQDIIDGCDGLCPYNSFCNFEKHQNEMKCLLSQTYYNLQFILEKSN